MFAVRLPENLEQRLQKLALDTERSKSFYVRKAIEAYLEDQEDYQRAIALKQRIDTGLEKTYSLAEVEKILAQHHG